MAKADSDTHKDVDKTAAKIGLPAQVQSAGTPEQRLADMERAAGLYPDGNDADGRERRLARLKRVWGTG